MDFLEPIIKTFETGAGFWNPLIWLTVVIIAFLLMYIIRGFGKKGFAVKNEKGKVFLSGNPEYKKEQMHVPASNVYWGFNEALKWLYNYFDKMHTGNASDYILWFVIILGLLFIFIGVI